MEHKLNKNADKVEGIYEQVCIYRVCLKGINPDLTVKIYKKENGKFFPIPNYWPDSNSPNNLISNEYDTPDEAVQELVNIGLELFNEFENQAFKRNDNYYVEEVFSEESIKRREKKFITEIKTTNSELFTSRLSNGLAIATLPFALFSVTIFLNLRGLPNITTDDWVSLVMRTSASLAMFYQSDHYRRNVFIFLPKANVIFLFASFSGIIYIVCISFIVHEPRIWLLLFGVMMFILYFQNGITYLLLKKVDMDNPLTLTFKNWYRVSLGYFLIILSLSPLTYYLKNPSITTIALPILEIPIPSYYVDFVPGIILFSSMILSASRLDKNLKSMTEALEKHYAQKYKESNAN